MNQDYKKQKLEKLLLSIIKWGVYFSLFTPLIVTQNVFVPFVVPKTIFLEVL